MGNPTARELVRWFAGRAGDHIKNAPYQVLLMELANMVRGDREPFRSVEEVCDWSVQEPPDET